MSLPLEQVAGPPDGELAARIAAGDTAALALLYRREAGGLLRLALRLLGNRADAEDVVQDLFVGLPEGLAGYREQGRLGGWLRRVAVNLALRRLRSHRRRREEDLDPQAALPGMSPEILQVRRAVDSLPETLRTAVVLKIVEGYSHAEIGELLGITRGASEVRLSRALDELRRRLGA